jgi:hypothetical protein
VCDLDSIGAPSILGLIPNTAVLARIFPTLDLSCEKNTQRPQEFLFIMNR